MGRILVQEKQYNESIKYYIKALKCSNLEDVYKYLGIALEKKL